MSESRRKRIKPFNNSDEGYTVDNLGAKGKALNNLFQANGFAVRPSLSGAFELSQPYEQSWIVYACCREWARAVSGVKIKLYSSQAADAEEVPESDPLYQTLLRPNRDMVWAQLAEADVTHRKLTGESFWFIFGPRQGSNGVQWVPFDGPITLPFMITPVIGDAVEYEPDEMGRPYSWYFQSATEKISAKWSSVIQFRDYDPADPLRGLGAAEVLNRQLQIAFQAERQQEATMRSGGPGAFVTYENDIQRESLEAFQSDLDAATQDAETAGGLKILGGNPKIVPNPATPDKMEFIGLLQWSRDVVSSTMQVPVHIVSPDASTYSNLQEAWRQFWTAVVGYLKTVEMQINAQLIARMADPKYRQYRFAFDFAGIEALRNDNSSRLKLAAEISLATGQPLDIISRALGIDIPADVMHEISEGMSEEPSEEESNGASEEDSEDESEDDSESDSENGAQPSDQMSGDAAKPGASIVSEQALNGAQVSSLLEILRAVSEGILTPDGAIAAILAAFPFFSEEQARRIVFGIREIPQPSAAESEAVSAAWLCENRRAISQIEVKQIDLKAPAYMRASARRGLGLHEEGYSGEGLKAQTVEDARKMAAGEISEAKWRKIGPWIARHIVDLSAVEDGEITPGLVAMLLWGGGSSRASAERAQAYAEQIVSRLDSERERAIKSLGAQRAYAPLKTREARAEYFRRFFKEVSEPYEKQAKKNVSEWLAEYEAQLIRNVNEFASGKKTFSDLVTKESPSDNLFNALLPDPEEWKKSLEKALSETLEKAVREALKDQAQELGGIAVPMTDPRVTESLKKQKIKVVDEVNGTLAERVRAALADELGEPTTFQQMRFELEKVLPEVEGRLARVFADKQGRAGVIARTETNKAVNNARFIQMKEEGVSQIQWISEQDDFVRESHDMLDGEIREIGQDFKPNLAYPGDDRAPAAEVINCRCVILALYSTSEEEQ